MATRYWVGGTGTWNASNTANWSASSGGAGGASAPVAADTVVFDSNSGTGTCTTASGSTCTTATLDSSTLVLKLGAAHTMSGTFTLTTGTIDLDNNTLTCRIFSSSNSNTRSIAFGSSGQITVTGNNTPVFNIFTATNFSYTGTSKVVLNYSGSTGTRYYYLGGSTSGSESNAINLLITAGTDALIIGSSTKVKNLDLTGWSGNLNAENLFCYGNLTLSSGTVDTSTSSLIFAATSGTQQVTTNGVTLNRAITVNAPNATVSFQDALTQGSTRTFTFTAGTLKLKAGVTSTVGAFATSGTTQKYLQSTTSGTQATLSDASGVNSVSYLTIADSFVTGGATWNSFYSNGNIDAGNNTNWDFGATPVLGAEYEYKLRSFTEPRRF